MIMLFLLLGQMPETKVISRTDDILVTVRYSNDTDEMVYVHYKEKQIAAYPLWGRPKIRLVDVECDIGQGVLVIELKNQICRITIPGSMLKDQWSLTIDVEKRKAVLKTVITTTEIKELKIP